MERARVLRVTPQAATAAVAVERFGDAPPPPAEAPALNNGLLAIVLFMGAEVMLFMALFGAFVLYKTASVAWPPPGQPRLPIGVTFANTAILLASAVAMSRAYGDLRQGNLAGLRRGLGATMALGAGFLLVQGYEWVELIRYGLTLDSSMYGTTFYTLIGFHGLHVAGAVIWVAVVLARAFAGRYSQQRFSGVQICAVYWYFVCALWVVLFATVYLA